MPACPSCGHEVPDDARYCGACGFQRKEATARPGLVGTTIAERYRVLRVIAEGGMGIVYEAEQPMGEGVRRVAIKTLLPELSRDPVVVSRFNRECSVVAGLEHPNTVRVYDFGTTDDGSLYIAMEYVAGRPLGDVIAEGPIPIRRCLGILEQIASALEEAHDQGIVHRDLKPDNIVLSERAGLHDFVKVLDFGIAKRSSAGGKHDTNLTQQGMILGTPPYMSPEQFSGEVLDRTSDVYSLGIILYEMVNARLPFDGDTPWQWAHQHMSVEPAPFTVPVPHELELTIRQALSKQKSARPRSALEFYRLLSAAASIPAGPLSRVHEPERTDPGVLAQGSPLRARTEPSMVKPPVDEPRTLDEGPDTSLVYGTTAPAAPAIQLPGYAGTGTDPVGPRLGSDSTSASRWTGQAFVPVPAPMPVRARRTRRRWALGLVGSVVVGAALASTWWVVLRGNELEQPPRPTLLPDAGPPTTVFVAEPPSGGAEESQPSIAARTTALPRRAAQTAAKPPLQTQPQPSASAPTTATPSPPASTSPFPLPFPIGLPPISLPLPGMASTSTPATPQPTAAQPTPPVSGLQQCTQATVLADSDLDAAVSQYQACESAVGRTASMPARAKIASVGIARATLLARQGRCDEANRVVQTLARIGAHRNAQVTVSKAGCPG